MVLSFPDTALEHMVRAEVALNLPDVHGPAPISGACTACQHGKPVELRQGGREVLDNAIDEPVQGGILTDVHERKNGDGRFIGNSGRSAFPSHLNRLWKIKGSQTLMPESRFL